MASQELLIELVKKRYTWDTFWFEKKTLAETLDSAEDKKATKAEERAEEKEILQTEKEYKEALAYIKDIIAPAFLKVYPDKIRINNTFAKTFFIYAYPNFLEGNWLSPIINWDVKFDMSLYVYPIEAAFIQKYLRKRVTQLYSERSINADKWLINDPAIDAQIQDGVNAVDIIIALENAERHLQILRKVE